MKQAGANVMLIIRILIGIFFWIPIVGADEAETVDTGKLILTSTDQIHPSISVADSRNSKPVNASLESAVDDVQTIREMGLDELSLVGKDGIGKNVPKKVVTNQRKKKILAARVDAKVTARFRYHQNVRENRARNYQREGHHVQYRQIRSRPDRRYETTVAGRRIELENSDTRSRLADLDIKTRHIRDRRRDRRMLRVRNLANRGERRISFNMGSVKRRGSEHLLRLNTASVRSFGLRRSAHRPASRKNFDRKQVHVDAKSVWKGDERRSRYDDRSLAAHVRLSRDVIASRRGGMNRARTQRGRTPTFRSTLYAKYSTRLYDVGCTREINEKLVADTYNMTFDRTWSLEGRTHLTVDINKITKIIGFCKNTSIDSFHLASKIEIARSRNLDKKRRQIGSTITKRVAISRRVIIKSLDSMRVTKGRTTRSGVTRIDGTRRNDASERTDRFRRNDASEKIDKTRRNVASERNVARPARNAVTERSDRTRSNDVSERSERKRNIGERARKTDVSERSHRTRRNDFSERKDRTSRNGVGERRDRTRRNDVIESDDRITRNVIERRGRTGRNYLSERRGKSQRVVVINTRRNDIMKQIRGYIAQNENTRLSSLSLVNIKRFIQNQISIVTWMFRQNVIDCSVKTGNDSNGYNSSLLELNVNGYFDRLWQENTTETSVKAVLAEPAVAKVM